MIRHRSYRALGALLLALVLSACGADPTPTSVAPPGSSPDGEVERQATITPTLPPAAPTGSPSPAGDVLARARDAIGRLTSFQYTADGEMTSNGGASSWRTTGAWAEPDRFRLRIEDTGETQDYIEVVSVGERTFARGLETGDTWEELAEQEAAEIRAASIGHTPSALLPLTDTSELVGDEVLDGVAVYHLRGNRTETAELPEETPAELLESIPIPVTTLTYDLYVSRSSLLPLRMVVRLETEWRMPEQDGTEPLSTSRTMSTSYWGYNEPVEIVLPEE